MNRPLLALLILIGVFCILTNPNKQEHLDTLKISTPTSYNKIEDSLTYNNYLFFSTMSIDIEELSPEMSKLFLDKAGELLDKVDEIENQSLKTEYLFMAGDYMDAVQSYSSTLQIGYFFEVRKLNEFDEKMKEALKILRYR